MLKYIGIFLLSASLSAYGAFLSSSLKISNSLRKEIIQLLKDIERGIRYGKVSIIKTIKECRMPLLNKSGFCEKYNGCESAFTVISSTLNALCEKDREMLCGFFSQLGRSAFGEYELKNCLFLIDYFEKTQAESEKDIISKSLLYQKIGLIIGILSAIIFI